MVSTSRALSREPTSCPCSWNYWSQECNVQKYGLLTTNTFTRPSFSSISLNANDSIKFLAKMIINRRWSINKCVSSILWRYLHVCVFVKGWCINRCSRKIKFRIIWPIKTNSLSCPRMMSVKRVLCDVKKWLKNYCKIFFGRIVCTPPPLKSGRFSLNRSPCYTFVEIIPIPRSPPDVVIVSLVATASKYSSQSYFTVIFLSFFHIIQKFQMYKHKYCYKMSFDVATTTIRLFDNDNNNNY